MSATVYTQERHRLHLTDELGRGGEGTVYALPQDPLECAKIYYKPLSPPSLKKLELMVLNPPRDPTFETRKHRSICWPSGLLYDSAQKCVGFLMPKLDVKRFQTILHYIDPADRHLLFGGGFTWQYLCTAAFNIASSVAAIHERGYCIGDLNESNVLVAPNALIVLIDCDSFQVKNPSSGKVYRCPVGKPEYAAPELQGKSYRDIDRTPESDCFALSVLIFQLLMEGAHPYQGKGKLVEDAPSTQAKIKKGYFSYSGQYGGLAPPDYAPPFELVPPEIRLLFHRCFAEGHGNPRARPTAREWFATLLELRDRFKSCSDNQNHVFMDHLSACPWCEIAKTGRRDPFAAYLGIRTVRTTDSLDMREASLRSYASLAVADGVLTDEEKSQFIKLAKDLRVPYLKAKEILSDAPKSHGKTDANRFANRLELKISDTRFDVFCWSRNTTVRRSFILSNAGEGVMRGSIRSNREWLKPATTRVDPTQRRQEIAFEVDCRSLARVFRDNGRIEIRANTGLHLVWVNLEVGLTPYRGFVSLAGMLQGGLVGYFGGALVSYALHLVALPFLIILMRRFSRAGSLGLGFLYAGMSIVGPIWSRGMIPSDWLFPYVYGAVSGAVIFNSLAAGGWYFLKSAFRKINLLVFSRN